MAFEILIGYILPIAVEHAKGSAEVPHRPAPAPFPPQFQAIAHPRQHHRVRGGRERSPLADMHTHTFFLQGLPRRDPLPAQTLLIELVLRLTQWPAWFRPLR